MKIFHLHIRNTRGFTLVELLIGMTIFAIGMTAILALLNAAVSSSIRSKNEIIAANFLREQVELIKNIRNTNLRSYAPWSLGITPDYSVVENNYTNSTSSYAAGVLVSSPVSLTRVNLTDMDSLEKKFNTTRLYIDNQGKYTHQVTETGSNFASYIIISPLKFSLGNMTNVEPKNTEGKNQGYILDARVIVHSSGYREYDLKTLITSWQK